MGIAEPEMDAVCMIRPAARRKFRPPIAPIRTTCRCRNTGAWCLGRARWERSVFSTDDSPFRGSRLCD